MSQPSKVSEREALANQIHTLFVEFKPEETEKAIDKYEKLLDKECAGERMLEASDYVFLWTLECENNQRLHKDYANYAILNDAAALVDSFPDSLSGEQKASARYEDIEDISEWKYESYCKIAQGYYSDGRRADAAKYYAKANGYLGNGREEVSAPESFLKYDPVEDSEQYLAIKSELEKKLYKKFKGELRGMGFCFMYWSAKSAMLKSEYGIEWRSPAIMNPRVMFD